MPVRLRAEKLFNSLLAQYHYLGYTQPVGEQSLVDLGPRLELSPQDHREKRLVHRRSCVVALWLCFHTEQQARLSDGPGFMSILFEFKNDID